MDGDQRAFSFFAEVSLARFSLVSSNRMGRAQVGTEDARIKLGAAIELTCSTPAGRHNHKAPRAGEQGSNETVPIKAKSVVPRYMCRG